jgi:integrase
MAGKRGGPRWIAERQRYQVRVTLADGRREARDFATEGEALKWWHEVKREAKRRPELTPGITFGEFIEAWQDRLRLSGTQDQTMDGYKNAVSHFLPAFEKRAITSITRDDIVNALGSMSMKCERSTLAQRLSVLSILMNAAKARGLFSEPPTRGLGRELKLGRTTSQTEVEVLEESQLVEVLAGAEGTEAKLPVFILALAGLRIGECCGLTKADLKTETAGEAKRHTLNVARGIVRNKGARPTKGKLARTVPAVPALVSLWDTLPAGPLFPKAHDAKTAGSELTRVSLLVADLGKRLGVHLNPHLFRHTWAATLLAKGEQLTKVSYWLGHKSTDFTARVYGQWLLHKADSEVLLGMATRILAPPK